jgi:hypothetical protein
MIGTPVKQPDRQLQFLHELIEEHASIAGDIAEIGPHTFVIHGVIPVDGAVLVAEFGTYDQARSVLDQLAAARGRDTALS